MRTEHGYCGNENGSVLIVVLIVMALLAIIATMGSESGYFEIKLAGVEKQTAELRINAESAAMTSIQQLENLINSDSTDDQRRVLDIDWDSMTRFSWLHKGGNNTTSSTDGTSRLKLARDYSQNYQENWIASSEAEAGSCSSVIGSDGNPIQAMENAKYMVVDYGIPATDSIGISLTPKLKRKHYLISGVDETQNGIHMVQIGYSNLVMLMD